MGEWTNTGDELKTPGERSISGESSSQLLAFEGTMKTYSANHALENHQMGSGHLGPSYVGVASKCRWHKLRKKEIRLLSERCLACLANPHRNRISVE